MPPQRSVALDLYEFPAWAIDEYCIPDSGDHWATGNAEKDVALLSD